MKWYGGRNQVRDVTDEYVPGSGFTYLTDLSAFPDLWRGDYLCWAHAESQPVQVTARLRIAEISNWQRPRRITRQASCELLVDGHCVEWVMPSEPVDSCAHAKRRAEAHLYSTDQVHKALKLYYGGTERFVIEQDGAAVAVLFARRAHWMLDPGRYIEVNSSGHRTSLLRSTTSITLGADALVHSSST